MYTLKAHFSSMGSLYGFNWPREWQWFGFIAIVATGFGSITHFTYTVQQVLVYAEASPIRLCNSHLLLL